METERKGIRLREINDYLTCSLCHGYLIDATTIVECLHSFCRTCIVHYLHTSNYCPTCECVIHKKNPHQNIRPDRLLQDIVYKIVPGLFKEELRRRQDYFIKNNHPKEDWDKIARHSRRRFFSQDEKISLCLELSRRKKREKFVNKNNTKEASRRYLLCPAKITIRHLKKFLQLKFSLTSTHKIDMWHSSETLADDFSLIDVAYVIRWKRKKPMRIQYCIYSINMESIVDAQSQSNTIDACANSPGNDSGIEDESPSFEVSFEEATAEENDVININDVVEKVVKVVDDEESAEKTLENKKKGIENEFSEKEKETSENENTENKPEKENVNLSFETEKEKDNSQANDIHSSSSEKGDITEDRADKTDEKKDDRQPETKTDTETTDEYEKEDERDGAKSDIEEKGEPLRGDNSSPAPVINDEEPSDEEEENEEETSKEKETGEDEDSQDRSSSPDKASGSPLIIDSTNDQADEIGKKTEVLQGDDAPEASESCEEESEETTTDDGPTYNDSVAQTSPYYDEDETEEIWNESAIDLTKPKMIVIEPLQQDDMDGQKEINNVCSDVQKPTETVTETMKLPTETEKVTETMKLPTTIAGCKMEQSEDECEVEEYTYVVDGIHEIENPIQTDYIHIHSGINEHSYSMLPNAEPVAIISKAEPVRNVYKPTISIPKLPSRYLQHCSARSFAPALSYDLPSTSSRMTPRNSISSNTQPTRSSKRKYERTPRVQKESKTGCKKRVRKCTSVCNGHLVSPRNEKLVVKLSKARNSNNYTATMT